MKLWPVTEIEKRNNWKILTKIDDNVMSKDFDHIAIFSTYGQFVAIHKTHSGNLIYKTQISIKSNL